MKRAKEFKFLMEKIENILFLHGSQWLRTSAECIPYILYISLYILNWTVVTDIYAAAFNDETISWDNYLA